MFKISLWFKIILGGSASDISDSAFLAVTAKFSLFPKHFSLFYDRRASHRSMNLVSLWERNCRVVSEVFGRAVEVVEYREI